MWIIIAIIICIAAAVSLLAVAYDLDKETPGLIRWLLTAGSVMFLGVGITTYRNPAFYPHAAGIAIVGLAVLALVYVTYLIMKRQIQPIVAKVSGFALGVSLLIWVVGSCSDIKRQEIQIENANAPTSNTVATGATTQQHIDNFKKLRR